MNSVLIFLSYCLYTSCSLYIKCSMCPSCCWTTHSIKPATPLTNDAIIETLRQLVPLSDDTLEVWWHLSLVIVLLQIFSPFWHRNSCENRLIFGEVIGVQNNGANFLGHPVCDSCDQWICNHTNSSCRWTWTHVLILCLCLVFCVYFLLVIC